MFIINKVFKQFWQSPSNRQKKNERSKAIMKSLHITPNKPESKLIELLNKHYPKEYEFVGDGKVIIEGCNPDFINVNGKKYIIEVFGLYWHNNKNTKYNATEKGRIELFAKYGYSTLVIWEKEFKDEAKLLIKIGEFHKGVLA